MTVSSVPAHLSRGMSDYAWSLRRAVLHQLLPHATLKAGLPLFSPPTPAPWNPASAASLSVSTVIYYTSIVMKTCLIHNVYCGRKKWLVNLKNRALLQRWQNKKKASQWEKAHLTIYYCLRLLEGWHVQRTLHETAAAFYSQKTYLSHHTDWGEKGLPSPQSTRQSN